MRNVKQKKEQAKRKREIRAEWREHFDDKGRDATRLSRLSKEQLACLFNAVAPYSEIQLNKHGNDSAEFEMFWCFESTQTKLSSGYPVPRLLPMSMRDASTAFSPTTSFMCGAIVLAQNGYFADDPAAECSHLCHNPACVRASHLRWESRQQNEARKNCLGTIFCGCGHSKVICPHVPTCIKKTNM